MYMSSALRQLIYFLWTNDNGYEYLILYQMHIFSTCTHILNSLQVLDGNLYEKVNYTKYNVGILYLCIQMDRLGWPIMSLHLST